MERIVLRAETTAGNAERSDRIPHADTLHGNGFGFVASRSKSMKFFRVTAFPFRIPVPGIVKMRHLPLLQKTDAADHAGDAAHDVGATREPEQQNLVTRFVIVDQEAITGLHTVREADTGAAADRPIENISGSDTQVVVHDLRHRPAIRTLPQRPDRAQQPHDIGFSLRLRPVPRSVAADNEATRCRGLCLLRQLGTRRAIDQPAPPSRQCGQPFQPGVPRHFSDELRHHHACGDGGDILPAPPVENAVGQYRKYAGEIVPTACPVQIQPLPRCSDQQARRQGPGQHMRRAAHQPDP